MPLPVSVNASVKVLILIFAIGLAPAAYADSFRCNNATFQRGALLYEISELCGEPAAQFSRLEQLAPNVVVYVDELVYRRGTNRFQRLLRFENGRLRTVRNLRKPRPEAYTGPGAQSGAAEYTISY